MSNKFFNDPFKRGASGGKDTTEAEGAGDTEALPTSMPMRTANWPGLPGAPSASRALGTPQKGWFAPFQHKKVGM